MENATLTVVALPTPSSGAVALRMALRWYMCSKFQDEDVK